MSTEIPQTMRSLVAPRPCKPAGYAIMEMPVPRIRGPSDVLIRVHAASIITGDTHMAAGALRFIAGKAEYPFKLGITCSGEVVAIGDEVRAFKVGDAVYGVAFGRPSFCSEYCLAQAPLLLPKPPHIPHEHAVALGGPVVTALQSLDLAQKRLGRPLAGATVLVPAALSATGSIGVQLLRNVYGAGRIVSTASTGKIEGGMVDRLLGLGVVDLLVDYQRTPDLGAVVPPGSVDVLYNTQWATLAWGRRLVNREGGSVVSIASYPPSGLLREMLAVRTFFWVYWVLDLMNWFYRWRLRGTNISYDFVSGNAGVREDLERAGELIALGKVRPVLRVVRFDDLDAVRTVLHDVYTGKGGFGQVVVKII